MIISILIPFLMFIKKPWVPRLLQIILVLGALEWVRTVFSLIKIRNETGESWTRMAIILFVVGLFTLLSALVFERPTVKKIYKQNKT